MVEQSGLGIASNAVIGIAAVFGLAAALLGYLLVPLVVVPPIALVVGAALPVYFVKHRRDARLEKLLSQLPDAFDLMARVMRAGQTMTQAFRSVADEFPPPISTEFAICFEQQNLGIDSETSLRDLAQRTGLLELKILVVGVIVQEQTGGNLADMLDKLERRHPRALPAARGDQDAHCRGANAGHATSGPAAGALLDDALHESILRA